jgi:hypothetical protein
MESNMMKRNCSQMNVQVTILVSSPPSDGNINSLRSAALELTNDWESITVKIDRKGIYYNVSIDFTMQTATEYKVIDEVEKEFKLRAYDLTSYRDMVISFSKET